MATSFRDVLNFITKDRDFVRIGEKQNFDIYISKDVSMFANGENYYILLFVKSKFNAEPVVRSHEVFWESMQFRNLKPDDIDNLTSTGDIYIDRRLKGEKFTPPPKNMGLDIPLQLVQRMDRKTIFTLPQQGGTISILHGTDETKKPPSQLGLIRALLTWRCVIELADKPKPPPVPHIFLEYD